MKCLLLFHAVSIIVLLLSGSAAFGQQAVLPAPQTPVSELLNADGTLNLDSGFSGSLDMSGFRLITGPDGEPRFVPETEAPVASVPSLNPVPGDEDWDGQFFGKGPDQAVEATAVIGTDLYIVGVFETVGDIVAHRIARWDGSKWSGLGPGLNNYVFALTAIGSDLYAGGDFTQTADGSVTELYHIAKWDGSNWSGLGPGLNYTVRALTAMGSDLYAGGDFTQTADGSVTLNRIARWDGSKWSGLGPGLNYTVRALTAMGSDLCAGGGFTQTADGSVTGLNRIARWDGSNWSALGPGLNNYVFALAAIGSDLYAGGYFNGTADGSVTGLNYIAKWDGSNWSALGPGLNYTVLALTAIGSDLYAGGYFTQTADGSVTGLNRIAKWDGSKWSGLGPGLNNNVRALAAIGSDLYAGGYFTQTADGSVIGLNHIAKWDGSNWSGLGPGLNNLVLALTAIGSDLYVGGYFNQTADGNVTLNYIAKWDGNTWSSLGSGLSYNVRVLTAFGSDLYAGGDFTQTADGSVTLNRIAKWDGSKWSGLGPGLNYTVLALTAMGSDLYAGGLFTQTAGSVTLNRIAKWDGSNWSGLGSGLNNYVWDLATIGSDLYAGGYFTVAGNKASWYIGRYSAGQAPVSNANGPYEGSEGSAVRFSSAGSTDPDGKIVSYFWDFGDGSTSTDPHPTHIYQDDGTYAVSLTVTDNEGFSDRDETVALILNVAPTITALSYTSEIPGFPLPGKGIYFVGDFTDPGTLDLHTAKWDFADGTPEETELPVGARTTTSTHIYNTPGTYSVTLTITDDDQGAGSGSIELKIPRAQEAITELISDVEALLAAGSLTDGQASALISKLEAAKAHLDKGHTNGAIQKLGDFIDQVEAFINGGVLTTEEGQPLVDAANGIIILIQGGFAMPGVTENSPGAEHSVPTQFTLEQNYPNPFNPITEIRFALPQAGHVVLSIYNMNGQLVRTLVAGSVDAGYQGVQWDGTNEQGDKVASGVYVCRISTGSFVQTKKMILMR